MVYGSVDDPGVEWKTVSYLSYSSRQFAPTPLERASRTVWRKDNFEQSRLISDCDLALHDLKSWKNLPGMSVQVSLFGNGGYAIGVKLAHVLGDAQSLMTFVRREGISKAIPVVPTLLSSNRSDWMTMRPVITTGPVSILISQPSLEHCPCIGTIVGKPMLPTFRPFSQRCQKEPSLHHHSLRISYYPPHIQLRGYHGTLQNQLAMPRFTLVERC